MRSIVVVSLFAAFGSTPAIGQQGFLKEFAQKWGNATEYTLEVVRTMPSSAYDYAPTEEQMTFGEQILHLLGNMSWLSSEYLGGQPVEFDRERKDYTKADLVGLLQDGFQQSAAAVAALSEEDLDEVVEFFAGPMTKRQILVLMNDHLTHHRAQLIVYARLNGVAAPRYLGW